MKNILCLRDYCLKYIQSNLSTLNDKYIDTLLNHIECAIKKQKYIKKLSQIKHKIVYDKYLLNIIIDVRYYLKKNYSHINTLCSNYNYLFIIFIVEKLVISK